MQEVICFMFCTHTTHHTHTHTHVHTPHMYTHITHTHTHTHHTHTHTHTHITHHMYTTHPHIAFPESSLNIIALRRDRSHSKYPNGTDDFHSLPTTIEEKLSNGISHMTLVDPILPVAMHRKRPSSIQPLIHSHSDPVMPDASRSIPHRKLSLGINSDAETDGGEGVRMMVWWCRVEIWD